MFKKLLVAGMLALAPLSVEAQVTEPPSLTPPVYAEFGYGGVLTVNAQKAYLYDPQHRYLSDGWAFFWLFNTPDYRNFVSNAYYVACADRVFFRIATSTGTTLQELQDNQQPVTPVAQPLSVSPANPISMMAANWCEFYW